MTSKIRDDANSTDHSPGGILTFSNTLTPILGSPGIETKVQIVQMYRRLVSDWITCLASGVPNRVRVALERVLRGIAAQLTLASYAIRFDEIEEEDEVAHVEVPATGHQFELPVRRRLSFTNVQKGKMAEARSPSPPESSQNSIDAGFLASAPQRALPTPEPTPSLYSQSSISSVSATEDPASIDLRYFTSLAPQPLLPTESSQILDHWNVGTDPASFDWEVAQRAMVSDREDDAPKSSRKKLRAEKNRRRYREAAMVNASQHLPMEARLVHSQQDPVNTQEDSQLSGALITASQIEPGRYGGRPKKAKKKRRGGF